MFFRILFLILNLLFAQIYKEFGLDPNLLEDPYKFNFDEWGKHMKEKANSSLE